MYNKKYYRDRKNQAWNGWFYSMQRMDLLVISISGAGLYLIIETLKFSRINLLPSLCILKVAGFSFVIAIIANFLSQHFGKKSNYYDIIMCDEVLSNEEISNINSNAEYVKYDNLAEEYSILTKKWNVFSWSIMLLAVIVVLIYFCIIF